MATFQIGERTFEVPRLRVGPYERAMLALKKADDIPAAEDEFGIARVTVICEALVGLLREKAPDLTVEALKELVALDELDATLAGVLAAGGKKRADPGEGVTP